MEKRVIIAVVISFLVLLLWTKLFPPPKAPPKQAARAVAGKTTTPQKKAAPAAKTALPANAEQAENDVSKPGAEAVEHTVPVVRGESDTTFTFKTPTLSFDVLSRGGTVSSFLLAEQRTEKDQPVELLPGHFLQLKVKGDKELTDRINGGIYRVVMEKDGVEMTWGDGSVWVYKSLKIKGLKFACRIEVRGVEKGRWGVVMGPTLRKLDKTEEKSRFVRPAIFVDLEDGKVKKYAAKKAKDGLELTPSIDTFFGLDDQYFCAIFFPDATPTSIHLQEVEKEIQGVIYPAANILKGSLYVGGKSYDVIKTIDPRMVALIHFGWFSIIAKPLFWGLKYIYAHVHNYGWAIILLTFILRILLFPLTHKQLSSMKGMQKLQPRVERLKAKYKKHKSDPDERAKMNQEMMALYKEAGVNPLGGCLPLIIQIPILWAFYNLLSGAIELRHAPFLLWITDLSAPDPYYITPILMGVAMLVQQVMTPTAGSAAQKKSMLIMPVVFTFLFLGFPSGLVLYWLTNNVFQILQTGIYHRLEAKES